MSRLKRIEAVLSKAEFAADQLFIRMVARIESGRQKIIDERGIEYVKQIESEVSDAQL